MGSAALAGRAGRCCLGVAALSVATLCAAQSDTLQVGSIDFFGTAGIDVAAVRAAMPLHEGDTVAPDNFADLKARLTTAIAGVTGTPPTDVSSVCCDGSGRVLIYIGLPGTNIRAITHVPPPTGPSCLPVDALQLYQRGTDALQKALQAGDTGEDHSSGYALSHHPEYRDAQLAMRQYAVAHERQIRSGLRDCVRAEHRAAAAQLIGYARRSRAQIDALVRAANDADPEVRNNAVRALWVLASARDQPHAASIPATPFIAMLNSGTWEDRNKAGLLLSVVITRADAPELAHIRRTAMDSLVEMARWREPGHAFAYRVLLGRIAGFEGARLNELVEAGEVETIIAAAQRR